MISDRIVNNMLQEKHYPKPKYSKCNRGHELVEMYDERINGYVWDCPLCINSMRGAGLRR
jgi:hypothetical protein